MKAVVEQEDNGVGKKSLRIFPEQNRLRWSSFPGSHGGRGFITSWQNGIKWMNIIKITSHCRQPKLSEPSLYFEQAQVYSAEGCSGEASLTEGYEMAELAQEQIVNEAIEQGILQAAEKQAVEVIEKFMEQLGYEASVEFAEQG